MRAVSHIPFFSYSSPLQRASPGHVVTVLFHLVLCKCTLGWSPKNTCLRMYPYHKMVCVRMYVHTCTQAQEYTHTSLEVGRYVVNRSQGALIVPAKTREDLCPAREQLASVASLTLRFNLCLSPVGWVRHATLGRSALACLPIQMLISSGTTIQTHSGT